MDKHDFKFNEVKKIKKTRKLAKHLCTLYKRVAQYRHDLYIASYEDRKRPRSCPIDYQLKNLIAQQLNILERERQQELAMRDGAIAN